MRPYRWPIWLADGENEKGRGEMVSRCLYLLVGVKCDPTDGRSGWQMGENEKGRGDGRAAPGLLSRRVSCPETCVVQWRQRSVRLALIFWFLKNVRAGRATVTPLYVVQN